eukprot:764899-Hanusia_phi.AAC.4
MYSRSPAPNASRSPMSRPMWEEIESEAPRITSTCLPSFPLRPHPSFTPRMQEREEAKFEISAHLVDLRCQVRGGDSWTRAGGLTCRSADDDPAKLCRESEGCEELDDKMGPSEGEGESRRSSQVGAGARNMQEKQKPAAAEEEREREEGRKEELGW